MSREADLEIRFDRFLLPSTATRQSVRFYSESLDDSLLLLPEYDLVERVLVYHTPPLEPGVLYTVELVRPEVDDPDFGFRAFDGAPLEDGDVPLKFQFKTEALEPVAPPAPPAPPTCDDLLEIFAGQSAGCSGNGCHSANLTPNLCPPGQAKSDYVNCGPVPRMGLDLSTPLGISLTAINRVAHQAETGSKTGAPIANPSRFGTSMPIVDPGRPENSYLLYKMLRKDESFWTSPQDSDTCQTIHNVPFAQGACTLPSLAERDHMREWFVRGEAMPLVLNPSSIAYGRDAVRGVQEWIRAGAVCN